MMYMESYELSFPKIAKLLIPTEAAAYEFLERLRWNGHPVCPHCDSDADHRFLVPANGTNRETTRGSLSERRVWKCRDCKRQFSVITNTVMHGTHISLRTWIFVIYEMASNKNGLAAREVERKYGLSAKSAWFLTHRVREAMKRDPLAGLLRGTVVSDETFIGGSDQNKHAVKLRPQRIKPKANKERYPGKSVVLSLVETGSGEVRSFVIPDVTGATVAKVMADQIDQASSFLDTDEGKHYIPVRKQFLGHETVNHNAGEYVKVADGTDVKVSTNVARTTSPSSRHQSTAPTTSSATSTCTATWPSSTSATPPGMSRTRSGCRCWWDASAAGGSAITH